MGAAIDLTGVHVPLVTPFDTKGAVDTDALERLANRCLDAGAQGIVALATTGEATSLTADERDLVVEVCAGVASARSATLTVGAGTNDTRSTIERHEALAAVPEVTASLAVVPYYVRPSEAAILEHFRTVAARSPVPVVAYNIPYRTGRGLGAASLLELASIDNVAGVKQAVGSIDADTLTVLADCPDDFAVLAGDDPYLFPVVLMGGRGVIAASANVCTDQFAAMIDAGLAGDVATGRRLHERLLPLALALFAEPSPAVIKAVLHEEGVIPTPDVRMPLANASEEAARHAGSVRARLLD
jgi:4-hydroxy-tetrahydrodipicolinate synthase